MVSKSRQNPQPHGVHSLRVTQILCKSHELYKTATATDFPQERGCAVSGRFVPLRVSFLSDAEGEF